MTTVKIIIAAALLAAGASAIEVVYVKSFPVTGKTGLSVNTGGEVFSNGTGYVKVYTSMGSLLRTWTTREVSYDNDVDNQGYVYICEAESARPSWPRRIYKYTEAGSFVTSFGFTWPGLDAAGVASDDGGYLYATTRYYHVCKGTTAGSFLTSWGGQGSGPGQFDSAKGVRVGPDGNVYVTEWGTNKRVQVFTPAGSFLRMWGTPGQGPGLFEQPWDLTFDRFGYVHIADNDGVEVFTSTGSFVTHYGEQETGISTYIDAAPSGYVYVVDPDAWEIDVYYVSGDAVAPASLGRVKALFR